MQITIKTLRGITNTVEIDNSALVDQLRAKVASSLSSSTDKIRMIYKGRELNDGEKISNFNLTGISDNIYVIFRIDQDSKNQN